MRVAKAYPEKLYAYVGVAQIVNDYEQNRILYEFLLERTASDGDTRRQSEIEAIGPPPYDMYVKSFELAPKSEIARHIVDEIIAKIK